MTMRTRANRRLAFQLESLEGRKAPSAGLSSSLHRVAEVHRAEDDNLPRHSGKDERIGHNAGDDNLPRHSGKDDGPNHNAGDDNHRNRHGR
jgi:hypothetical protein